MYEHPRQVKKIWRARISRVPFSVRCNASAVSRSDHGYRFNKLRVYRGRASGDFRTALRARTSAQHRASRGIYLARIAA